MPILSHGLLVCEEDGLSITTTDLEVYAKATLPGQVVKSGKCCIPIRSLTSIIKDLPSEEILFKLNDNQFLEISSGSAVFRLNTLPPEDFPAFQVDTKVKRCMIQSSTLKRLLDLTLFSMSSDETRIVLNSVLFDLRKKGELCTVSTDGHRLSVVDVQKLDKTFECSALRNRKYVLPKKGAIELKHLCDLAGEATIGMFESDQTLSFQFEHMLMSTRLIEGEYPDYEKVLTAKADLVTYTLDREQFAAALRRTSLLSSEKSRAVQFSFTEDKIDLYCTSESLGDARETIIPEGVEGFKGDKIVVTFNSRYLLEPISVLQSGKIKFGVKDRDTHVTLYPADGDHYRSIVMPMRI